MNILDENILSDQRRLLKSWRIAVHQIGYDIGRKGMQDDAIVPLLHQLKQATFFTRDSDFYDRTLCHAQYCLVQLSVEKYEVANFVRRLLKHPQFNTSTKRKGTVMRVSHGGILVWYLHAETECWVEWKIKRSASHARS